uniref:Uncharacterized protein n=2 Tax=Lotharella globosa TaxID=91324 RepID=A0A7S3YTC9_9EUKA
MADNGEEEGPTASGGASTKGSTPKAGTKRNGRRKTKAGSGVTCSVKTVSVSWRVVLGLHPQKGLLIMRPYSGGTLYSIRYSELLSCEVVDPVQLEFVFLDSHQTQRRVRFYNTKVTSLKDHIDRCMRKIVRSADMTSEQLAKTISANLASACATLVDKHLLQSRGLTTRQVRQIADSLLATIDAMMKERETPDEPHLGISMKTRQLVEKAVVKAVEQRTGWRPEIEAPASPSSKGSAPSTPSLKKRKEDDERAAACIIA